MPVASAILTTIMSTEQSPPTIETKVLDTAVDIQVFNSDGRIVRFGDIFADQKTIVIFIRAHSNPHIPMLPIDYFVCSKGISSVG